jgi:hypothetical protein
MGAGGKRKQAPVSRCRDDAPHWGRLTMSRGVCGRRISRRKDQPETKPAFDDSRGKDGGDGQIEMQKSRSLSGCNGPDVTLELPQAQQPFEGTLQCRHEVRVAELRFSQTSAARHQPPAEVPCCCWNTWALARGLPVLEQIP